MTAAGYSGTPLARKLGIKKGMTVGLSGSPDSFWEMLGDLPEDVDHHIEPRASDMFIIFGRWTNDLEPRFLQAMSLIPPDGAIWVAWPKKRSGVTTDLTENTMREMFLPMGMVDNKVCAIDETWSGLRFVVRRENRPGWASPSN